MGRSDRRLLRFQRGGTRTRGDTSSCRSSTLRACARVRLWFPAQRYAREHPQQTRRRVHLDALHVLFAILSRQVQRERAELPRLRRDRTRRETRDSNGAGSEQPTHFKERRRRSIGRTGHRQPFRCIPGALHGVKSAVVLAGTACRGIIKRCTRTTIQMDLQFTERAPAGSFKHAVICPVARFASVSTANLELDTRIREFSPSHPIPNTTDKDCRQRVLFCARSLSRTTTTTVLPDTRVPSQVLQEAA